MVKVRPRLPPLFFCIRIFLPDDNQYVTGNKINDKLQCWFIVFCVLCCVLCTVLYFVYCIVFCVLHCVLCTVFDGELSTFEIFIKFLYEVKM